jgi:hypothetical protein
VSVFRGLGLTERQMAKLRRPGGIYRSGTRVGFPVANAINAVNAIAGNTMFALPIPIEAPFRASAVEIQIGTTSPGITGKLGLALPGADGLPDVLLAECAGTVDLSGAADAILNATITGGVNVPMGWVWLLSVFSGTATPLTVALASSPANFIGHAVGNQIMSGYTSRPTSGNVNSVRVTRAQTFASAFPASLTDWTVSNDSATGPSGGPYGVIVVT